MSTYYILAFLIPLPLFFDLLSWSFVISPIDDSQILVEAGAPVPIGLAALALIIFFSCLRLERLRFNKALPFTFASLAVFSLILASRVEPLKLVALLLPALFLLAFSAALSQPQIFEKLAKGYLAGVLFQACLHACSIVFYSSSLETLFMSSRTFFGYEIYQAWVSYSALLSMAAGAAVIYALSLRNLPSMLRVLMLTAPIYLIVILSARKAALVDLVLIFLINTFLFLRTFSFSDIYMIRKRALINVVKLICISLFTFVFVFAVSELRETSLDLALEQRSSSYQIFYEMLLTLNWFQVLTGYESGWGGYSNFFVELIVRSGLIGMLAYLFGLFNATRRFYLALFVPAGEDARALRGDIRMKCWFAFALGTFIVGNLVNMNIQLPYYTTNFLMINVCFVFYYSRYFREKFRTFPAVRR